MPIFHGKEEWVTGGEFGPEASIFSVVVSIITLVILLNCKGHSEKSKKPQLPKEAMTAAP